MKKLLCLLLSAFLLLSVSACREAPAPQSNDSNTMIAGRDPAPTAEADADAPEESSVSAPDLSGLTAASFDPGIGRQAYYLMLPDSSDERSDLLAMQSLLLCSGHTADATRGIFETAGFEVVKQQNFGKDPDDPAHTCAWTLAKRELSYQGEMRTLFAIAVRGTNAGEWYSNFDFAPSHDDNTMYAENFLACAQEVLMSVQTELKSAEQPLILVCGHSRGAACANLIGLLLDETAGSPDDVFVYTFATPTTLRGEALQKSYPNIFNHINPCDMVPLVPLTGWGYGRAGTDIILPADPAQAAKLSDGFRTMLDISPTISSYYNDRHSLTGPGLSDKGMTTFEVMNLLTRSLLQADNGMLSGTPGSSSAGSAGSAEAMPEMSMESMVSPESDLYPLFHILSQGMENGGAETMRLLMQHMPAVYFSLLTNMAG